MGGFRIIEDGASADYEFEATAGTLPELFAVCGQATFAAMTAIEKVRAELDIEFEIQAATLEELLYSYLSELVFIKDTRKLFLSEFVIAIDDRFRLTCRARGELIDDNKHEIRTDVKAVTYHLLKITKVAGGYRAHVILDL